METTFVLLKPDCMEKKLAGDVIRRFDQAGFEIRACKMFRLSAGILKEHYAHIAHLPFYPEVEGFMQSAPVIALALRGEQAIERVREMVGPTDSTQAAKGTIRGDLGEDKMRNVVHASDSSDSAEAELKRFFESSELFG